MIEVEYMKHLENNELSAQTLANLVFLLEKRIKEIYNQAYKAGFDDGVEETTQKLINKVLAEVEE